MNDLITLKATLSVMTVAQMTELSASTGVSIHTMSKIKRGISKNPRWETVQKLMKGM